MHINFDRNVEPPEGSTCLLSVRPINTLNANFTVVFDWAVNADESGDNLRFFRPWLKNLIKYYFALETRLRTSEQKMQNFAECIAGKGKFCGRNAAASCAKNYGDSK